MTPNGDSDHSSSLHSSDAEITQRNLERVGQFTEKRVPAMQEGILGAAKEYVQDAKRRRKQGDDRKEAEEESAQGASSPRFQRGGK